MVHTCVKNVTNQERPIYCGIRSTSHRRRCIYYLCITLFIHYSSRVTICVCFSIDAAKHMWPNHITKIASYLNFLNQYEGFAYLTPPFIYQELIEGGNRIEI